MNKNIIFTYSSILVLLISCKSTEQINFIDDNSISLQDLKQKQFYSYPANSKVFLSYSKKPNEENINSENFFSITEYYTNVRPSKTDTKIPTNIFTKDYEYFSKKLDSKYVIYYCDEVKVKQRIAYFENNNSHKNMNLNDLNDIYKYLKNKNISFKVLKEKKDLNGISYADLMLTKDSLFCKVSVSKLESVSNIFYSARDTISTIRYGDNKYFYK
ncbi:hypothetical protein [Chryseobacterium sp. CT-SW4]|uniref:hypothetical protein n=1 Tax=Chryseobacterium sp. SW-1 TaxID=3157343 RepID=UPI003B01863E